MDDKYYCENCGEEYCLDDTGCELCPGCVDDICDHSDTITRTYLDSDKGMIGWEVVCKICGVVLEED